MLIVMPAPVNAVKQLSVRIHPGMFGATRIMKPQTRKTDKKEQKYDRLRALRTLNPNILNQLASRNE